MNAQAYAAVRTAVQFVVAWLAAHVTVFAAIPAAQRSTIADWLVTAVSVGLWTWGVRWLESRPGVGFWPRVARQAGKLLMLGLGKQPVYPDSPGPSIGTPPAAPFPAVSTAPASSPEGPAGPPGSTLRA